MNTYTRKELYEAICFYRQQYEAKEISERTFRYWRQVLRMSPDSHGLYWEDDLDRLKDVVIRMSQGQTIHQIVKMFYKE